MNEHTTVLSFDNVCFSYDEDEVLHGINFTINSHWFVGIVGPNGGGKTTLLRLALGLENPDRGTISLLGESPTISRKEVGYVMQHHQYDDRFPVNVLDVVLMGQTSPHMIGFYKKSDKRAAMSILDKVGMAGLARRPFASLSGGQRQRTLIAQALAGSPRLLMLDEPTANIDSEGEATINELLRALAGERSILMVSHNINTVLECATHVLCVNRSAVLNPLSEMRPDFLERARGGSIAVLHHELNCGVFNRSNNKCTIDSAGREGNGIG